MTAPQAVPQIGDNTSSEADGLLSLSDDQLAVEFGLAEVVQDRNDDGTFARKPTDPIQLSVTDDGDVAVEDPPVEGEVPVEGDGDSGASDGEEAPPEEPAKAPPRPLSTTFKLYDVDGTTEKPVAELQDLVVEYKADGEIVRDTLDKVVRRAQAGKFNERIQAELDTVRDELPKALNAYDELLEDHRRLQRRFDTVLRDDDKLIDERTRFLEENSPEALLQRERAELARLRASLDTRQTAAQVEGYLEKEILPVIDGYRTSYPEVAEDEIVARFQRGAQMFMRRGVVPPAKLPALKDFVERELGEYTAQLHDKRVADKAAAAAREQEALKRAKENEAKVKRTLARVQQPGSGPARTAAPVSRPIVSSDDALEDIVRGLRV